MTGKLSTQYTVRKADPVADRHRILELWSRITSGAAPDADKLDRFYLDNPAGAGTIYLLWHEPSNAAVGVACVARRDVLVDGKLRKGAVCGDLYIDRAHRSLGPTLLLNRHILDELSRDYELYYAFPNARAAPTIAALRRPLEGKLLELVLPLRVEPYLERWLPGPLARILAIPGQLALDLWRKPRLAAAASRHVAVEADDAFLDRLWQSVAAAGDAALGVRDSTFLQWRLRCRSSGNPQVFGVARADGTPAAYVAWEQARDGGIHVLDVLSLDTADFRGAYALFVTAMRQAGVRSVSARQATGWPDRVRFLRKLGFVPAREVTVFIGAEPALQSRLASRPLYVNAIDSDV